MKFPRINVNDKTVNLELTTTHAKVSHLVASLPTSCVRTACPKLSTSLEQIQGRRNWGAGRAAASVAIYQEGQGGQRCPFNLKDPWRNSELSEMLVQFFYDFASENARMQSSSFKNSTIARRRTPHTPIIQSIENMIRRSSTPDVSQTSLSIYQFKSALSRKSVPPCLHIVPTSLNKLLTTCNKLIDIIRLVARLFQQVRYSHDITILLQPCVMNLVTFLLYHDCIRPVRTAL
jgi:hypothetical protein